ncbi:hypothetical protein [Burkholderia multivorans]|uniref:hypothetical protein n=1 Tax=Burkholderia multivorans TaxID=87883 RepID=UPI0020195743|nr:hypothetical protein [Burkholderia multivorans]MCO1382562.1 hypothetical protein [Burkholderia multivorans]MCO1402696.1 hypothetical protein [Burkholderia multivorans]UQO78771.1 hypothetical protein L0Z12_07055 [Burkholderia multivorans]
MTTIFEPLYAEGQVLSERLFSPLRISDNSHAAWREVRILVDFYRRGLYRKNDFVGIFSPKFGLKTKTSALNFIEFVDRNIGADVCIINPFPQILYYSFNVWMQGEINHPGLMGRAQALLNAVGVDLKIDDAPRNDARTLCYSNFWVGTEKFWDAYIGGVVEPIATFLEENPEHAVTRSVMGETWHSDAAPFLPFIVERLFSTFLAQHPQINVAAYPIDDVIPYCLTEYERELVTGMQPFIDAADARGEFPAELKAMQELACRLYVRYAHEHFATNVHPHTGRTIQKV